MSLNLRIVVGRLLVMFAIVMGAVNLLWYETLEAATAEVRQANGPCYRRNKSTSCEFHIRYVTKTGATVDTIYTAHTPLRIGVPLAGLYDPAAPEQFHMPGAATWGLVPIMMLLIGLGCWAQGEYDRWRKSDSWRADRHDAAWPPDWVGRALRRMA